MARLQFPSGKLSIGKFRFGALNRPGRVVVLATTGYRLAGAVASSTASSVFTLGAVALSSVPDRAAAVGEILEQLQRRSKQTLPRTAILLSSCAASALLSLPVDPKKPRPAAQMTELVRWELEELSVQQSELWSIGAVLMGMGLITGEQRAEVEAAAQAEGVRVSPQLYQARGLVDGGQLSEALALQEQLSGGDDELATGWTGQTEAETDEEGNFSWLVSGVGSGQAEAWSQACRRHGLFLTRIYPRIGACLSLVEAEEEWLLVDVLPEQMGLFRGRFGRIDSVLFRPCAFDRVAAEVCEIVGDLVRTDLRRIHLLAPDGQWPKVAAALDAAFGRRGVQVVRPGWQTAGPGAQGPADPEAEPGERAAMAGAARRELGLARKALPLAPILAQKPPPPWWRRKAIWPWVCIGLLVAGLASYETYLRIEGAKRQAELTRLDIEYERNMKLKREAEALAAESKKLQAELTTKERELQEQEKLRDVLDRVIRHRQSLVPGLLTALSEAASELVMLDQLEESADRNKMIIGGWALTDNEAQRFANRLNDQLVSWKYRVDEVKLTRGKGRLGIEGYLFNILLLHSSAAPKPPQGPAPQGQSPQGPSPRTGKGAASHG